MLVIVAPGQGAQKPGLLTPWLDLPGVTDRLREWSEAIDLDLVHYGTEADAEEILDTAVAQPLLVAASLISADALLGERKATEVAGAVAGHSVGELAAAAMAGVFSPNTAVRLVRKRASAMAEAAAVSDTGMAAVLGGDPDEVGAHLEKLGLTAANINGAGQTVAAGTAEQLAALFDDRPEKARVRPLKVAGAFHTPHMAPAVSALEEAAAGVAPGEPAPRYVSNLDGQVVDSGQRVISRLVEQVSTPVRWDLCMETFQRLGATTLIELCPGGTLTGLAKRALPDVRTLALKSPDDLEAARELIAEHVTDAAADD